MKSKNRLIYLVIFTIPFLLWYAFPISTKQVDLSERIQISLREVGNQLLLANQDSTSRVLPILEEEPLHFTVAFQEHLTIMPDSLLTIVSRSFKKSGLPESYRVGVSQCIDEVIAYSYEMENEVGNDVVPCLQRELPLDCYVLDVKFTNVKPVKKHVSIIYPLIASIIIVLLWFLYNKNRRIQEDTINDDLKIGIYSFYPDQNKLIKEAREIPLSKKECEILAIFVEKRNRIVTREELTKRVWEDNGVFVGRSLDTYVSKLRKKIKDDPSLKLTNIHGVGYKLEVETHTK